MPDEAVLMTGDGNLVEMQATVRYTIKDPRRYLFDVEDPAGVVRDAAESVLRELTAGKTFADLLTRGREAFHAEALARLQDRCDGYGRGGLGVRLEGVSLADLHPPQEVVEAYHQVTMAMEKSDERVNQATAEALGRERAEEANKTGAVRKAEAEALDKVRRAEAMRDAVTARVRARKALAWDQEWALLRDAVLEAWNDPLPDEDERARRAAQHYAERRAEAVAAAGAADGFPPLLGGAGVGAGRPREGGHRRGERAGPAAVVADAVRAVPVPRRDGAARPAGRAVKKRIHHRDTESTKETQRKTTCLKLFACLLLCLFVSLW